MVIDSHGLVWSTAKGWLYYALELSITNLRDGTSHVEKKKKKKKKEEGGKSALPECQPIDELVRYLTEYSRRICFVKIEDNNDNDKAKYYSNKTH